MLDRVSGLLTDLGESFNQLDLHSAAIQSVGVLIGSPTRDNCAMPFPIDAKWIAQTEAILGVRFPASFVTAMFGTQKRVWILRQCDCNRSEW